MSGFSERWLALREPYDIRARNREVLGVVASTFVGQAMINVTDLACGTGSTFRTLSSLLPARQNWRLVDNDLSLLARAKPPTLPAGVTMVTTPVDLGRDLELALDGAVDLVTISAFLDLASSEWLERFTVECAVRKLPVYAALNYDGRAICEPTDPFDDKIIAAVNRHQLGDKGFGPSLGPAAASDAIARLERLSYTIVQGPSDWAFGPRDRDIQTEIVSGWASAARDMDDLAFKDIADWLVRRRDIIAAGQSSIRVGHVDFFAQPGVAR